MFTEGDSDDELVTTPPSKGGYTHLQQLVQDDENRERSQSTGSEQIGRFEVQTVTVMEQI